MKKNWKSETELLQALKQVTASQKLRTPSPAKPTANLSRLTKAVNRYNGLACKVKGNDEIGRITITYKGKTALEKIVALFEDD